MRYIQHYLTVITHKWQLIKIYYQLMGKGICDNVTPVQLLFHDVSKFSLLETRGYSDKDSSPMAKHRFGLAWKNHIFKNKHHWQHWHLPNTSKDMGTIIFMMPDKYVEEMVLDWLAASKVYTNTDVLSLSSLDDWEWFNYGYETTKANLHRSSLVHLEEILDALSSYLHEKKT